MFSKEYHFKYSDLDNEGNIKVSTIIDLLQDISILHSAHVGYTLKKMQDISLAMLLHGWRIKMYEPLQHDIPATFRTGIMSVLRCNVMRKYEIVQNGKIKGIATADWFSFDTAKKTIIRVPAEINSTYDCINEEDNNFPVQRLKPVHCETEVGMVHVTKRDLDTNDHMNNVKSVEVALDYLPDNICISEIQVMYIKELHKGNVIHVFVEDDNEGYMVQLCNETGDVCVMVRTLN